jgi:small conductance mechanosensitive channel
MSDVLKGFVEGLLGTSQLSALEWLGGVASRLTIALVVVALTFFVAARLRNGIVFFFRRNKGDLGLAILLGRIVYFVVLFLGVLVLLPVFGLSPAALLAALGVLGLAVSLAMQDVLKNVFAGIYLLIERPFRPGDVIKVRDFVGRVETVDLRTTTLRNNGDIVYVPNAILFSEVLVNRGLASITADENPE